MTGPFKRATQRTMPWHAPPEGERPQNWGTPWALFRELEYRYAFGGRFTLDAAADSKNAKCDRYFSEDDDAFDRTCWATIDAAPPVVWLNPPYDDIERWMARAFLEVTHGLQYCEQVVMLVPNRSSAPWYHELARKYAARIEPIRGRVHFDAPPGTEASQPFEHSMVVSFERPWSFGDVESIQKMRRLLGSPMEGPNAEIV